MSGDNTYDRSYFDTHQSRKLLSAPGDKPYLFAYWKRYLQKHAGKGRILDVGCGLGYFLKRAGGLFAESHGIDCSTYAIEQSRKTVPDAKTKVSGAEKLDYPDSYFDVVTAFDLVEHLKNPGVFFNEARRVVAPGGLLIFSTPNPESYGARTKGAAWFGRRDTSHVSVLPADQWRKKLQLSGFRVIRDGTDTLWDVPYFKHISGQLQWLLFIGLTWIFVWWKGFFGWKQGENYYCVAKKEDR